MIPATETTQRTRDPRRPIWEEPPTATGQAGQTVLLFVVLAVILVPLYAVVLTSLSDQASINLAGGMVLVPHQVTVESYRQIIGNELILHSMMVTVLCAYGLSRRGSFGHRTILLSGMSRDQRARRVSAWPRSSPPPWPATPRRPLSGGLLPHVGRTGPIPILITLVALTGTALSSRRRQPRRGVRHPGGPATVRQVRVITRMS
jgi:hypothetical protein